MEGIFFAKFDDILGPKVVCEAPKDKGYLEGDVFDRVGDYIIAKKELCSSLLTVTDNISGKRVMSSPLFVENDEYARNTFFFAFGFIFAQGVQTAPYQAVLKKLSSVMKKIEIESFFISKEENKDRLQGILENVLSDLSNWGESIIQIDNANLLALQITPRLVDPPGVSNHQVPVQIKELDRLVTKEWDLTIQQVLRYIDGERHISLIAEESGVLDALVRRCVRQLLYFRCVVILDIFQYSNCYMCTPRITELAENDELQNECVQYVWNGVMKPPSFSKVFHLYTLLRPGITVRDLCLLHDTVSLNIDARRLFTFGTLHGLIRRLHKYPVAPPTLDLTQLEDDDLYSKYIAHSHANIKTEAEAIKAYLGTTADPGTGSAVEKVFTLLNGRNCFDAVCAELWCPNDSLTRALRVNNNVAVIQR
uniref:Nitrogen permease regulator 2 n=1 Tax=Mucochytrium quahogii TaxID=96639 RepID=A0A7S2R7X6_9STRA|mmetsp:Transcript_19300/g.32281  ORF Transcript_19300/g.32281 Transcript_19300/m.32281 type:complete len:422 (+) Transcript_19300:298-1563(+)|eukprot:CAMPEP_0203756680 /NCGR_PEP_ID=MMETSP0098-20131031/9913_1 /ASSEMBLY_ACC=CAM_ASM_000208 /TAXON_ID=96639 /ORGANISM=" , Strain NY0313808BC1" /LENGTH=421 /DNA_ID=CAMNT_0050648647 /DNA_START=248 /DNA_END=1513 /DNA_ORIENTATION=-